MKKKPEVSIYMTTYFHEKYVAKAIESILTQKVNFLYEIIISDDCSKDNTQKIIKDYEKKYDFIKVNINKKNIGLTKNVYLARTLCTGKYITDLSGDDYWVDNSKLQKQYDFLETYNKYFGVSGRLLIEDNSNNKIMILKNDYTDKIFTLDMFLKGHNFNMNGFMFKNVYINEKTKEKFRIMPEISEYIDDLTDSVLMLECGDVYLTNDIMAVYRYRENENNFNSINDEITKLKKHIDLLNNLDNYYNDKYDFYYRYRLVLLGALRYSLLQKSPIVFFSIYKQIPKKYTKRFIIISTLILAVKRMINRI